MDNDCTIQSLLKDINQLSIDYDTSASPAIYAYLELKLKYLTAKVKELKS